MGRQCISVIVAIYKVDSYLDQCIQSIVNQTCTDLEIILVDDGSPDLCPNICDIWAKKDSRIRVIHKTNGGISSARNTGIRVASGKYMCFVDGDDWIEPEFCVDSLNAMEQYHADLVMGSYIREYETRSAEKQIFGCDVVFEQDQVKNQLRRRIIGLLGEELRNPELADSLSPVWGKLYRTELAKKMCFLDLDKIGTNEDGLFNLDYLTQTKRAVYLNKHWYHYRKGSGNTITSSFQENRMEKWQHMLQEIESRIDPSSADERQALQNRICLSMIGQSLNVARCDTTLSEKRKMLRTILKQDAYVDAFAHLDLQYFRPHWKLFFTCCKMKQCAAVLTLAESMLRLKRVMG